MPDDPKHVAPCQDEPAPKEDAVKDYRGANQRKIPKDRGTPFKPSDSLVSFTLR